MAITAPRPSTKPVLGVDVDPGAAGRAPAPEADRGGYVAAWGILGAGLVALALTVWARWVTSGEQFSPAPIRGPDDLPTWNLVALRVEEALSFVEMAVLFTFAVILPLRRVGRLGLDAKIAIGCLCGSVTDGVLNSREYLFAWNAHSINLGSWAEFIPTSTATQTRYAEALIWGIPMYTYFCIGVAVYGCSFIQKQRAKHPGISNVQVYAKLFALACLFDIVVENLVIRLGHGYAFVKTPSIITLDAGSQFQFPLSEMVTVALLGVLFTGLRMSAVDAPDGVSYVERGFHRLRPALQGPARWLAVMGWAITTLFVVYHLPFQFFGLNGNSVADLPSYMLPGS